MIPRAIHWLRVDYSTLCKPRYDYKKQDKIDPHQVNMANAAMIHFGLDPGKFVCRLGGKYTSQHCNVQATLLAVQNRIQIILEISPSQLKLDEPLSNKIEMINQGNSKSFNDNPDLVKKTMNKDNQYSHLIPLDELFPPIAITQHRQWL
jgi:hypothetical protein